MNSHTSLTDTPNSDTSQADPQASKVESLTVDRAPSASDGSESPALALGARSAVPCGPHARWWVSVGVGMVASLPIAWLLSFGAALPFLLGLFFFMLLGLLIGAVTHRAAAPGRPYNRWALLAGTTVIVMFAWDLALIKESRDFPPDMAKSAQRVTRSLGDRTPTAFRAEVADQVRAFLKTRHPPGGTLGYMRWMVASGKINKGELPLVNRTLRRPQARVWFVVRLVLSIALLAFGIGSQTLSLRLAREPSPRAIDDPDHQTPS